MSVLPEFQALADFLDRQDCVVELPRNLVPADQIDFYERNMGGAESFIAVPNDWFWEGGKPEILTFYHSADSGNYSELLGLSRDEVRQWAQRNLDPGSPISGRR